MAATSTASITRITPIVHADDAETSGRWYAQFGFEVEHTHQFEPGFPRFDTLRCGDLRIFLSEHGDAARGAVVYLHVEDVDALAATLGVDAEDTPWGMREFRVTDPGGNELRIGSGI